MIETIKDGKKRFVIVCLNCDAKYSYELNDVVGRAVRCPYCGEFCAKHGDKSEAIITKMFNGISEEQLQTTIQTIIQIEDNLKEI